MAKSPKRTPPVMHVTGKSWITPHMIRVTCSAAWMNTLEHGIEGAHFKLYIPKAGQSEAEFRNQLKDGPRPDVRTYTIRHLRPETGEMDIDFVDHGDTGPASAWARRCGPGDFAAFAGPGPVKLKTFFADTYVLAADMSALPVAAATLEAMPRDAKGVAVFEITAIEDTQNIDAPEGIDMHWLVNPDPNKPSPAQEALLRSLDWPTGRVQTCIAGESSVIKSLRAFLHHEKQVPREDTYISGYWKIGLVEDEHQAMKRAEA